MLYVSRSTKKKKGKKCNAYGIYKKARWIYINIYLVWDKLDNIVEQLFYYVKEMLKSLHLIVETAIPSFNI